ncbi:MAG: DUF1801 domain-containing protein, partial [Alphaproteobacteria bacterium]|nr:DUF1801 domain-containing protein [Alphaproteobacteria bacterium]
MAQPIFEDQAVAATFAGYPAPVRAPLLVLRAVIYDVARKTPGVGPLEETLKWGQPAYLTAKTRSGVTIRIAPHNSQGSEFAIYVSCNSGVVEDWRARYPTLEYGGNRSIRF